MNKLELIVSTIISLFVYLLGGFDKLLSTLLIFIIIDFITGICKGIVNKNLSSSISVKGIIKKFGYILIIIVCTLFDRVTNDTTFAIRTLIIYFFLANEAISIIENWASTGLPLPKKLYEIFNNYKET